jgi:hypothetical protein
MAFPGGNIFADRRPFRILGIKPFQAGTLKFEFAGLGLEPLAELLSIIRGQGCQLGGILLHPHRVFSNALQQIKRSLYGLRVRFIAADNLNQRNQIGWIPEMGSAHRLI